MKTLLALILVIAVGVSQVAPAVAFDPLGDVVRKLEEAKRDAERAARETAAAAERARNLAREAARKAEAAGEQALRDSAAKFEEAARNAQAATAEAADALDKVKREAERIAAQTARDANAAAARSMAAVQARAEQAAAAAKETGHDLATILPKEAFEEAFSDLERMAKGFTGAFAKPDRQAFEAMSQQLRPEIEMMTALAKRLAANDPAAQRVRRAVRNRNLAGARAALNALPEFRTYLDFARREAGAATSPSSDDAALGCAADADNDAFQTLTIGLPAVDASAVIGLGVELIGLAIPLADHACSDGQWYYYIAGSWSWGASFSASGGVSVGRWRGPNWCQYGTSAAVVGAAGAGIDVSVAFWYGSVEARNRYGTSFYESVFEGVDFNVPERQWMRPIGHVVTISAGVGAELLENTQAATAQFPRRELRDVCEAIKEERASLRTD